MADINVSVKNIGRFEVVTSPDPEFPGVDVEFIPKNDTGKTNPRIVFEYHEDETGKPSLHVHVWENPDSEDFSKTIYFDDIFTQN